MMSQSSTLAQSPATRAEQIAQFLRNYYIYFVLAAVIALLSLANLDRFDLFERGNFLYEWNIINIREREQRC